jgi:hypothetical protein
VGVLGGGEGFGGLEGGDVGGERVLGVGEEGELDVTLMVNNIEQQRMPLRKGVTS